MFLPVAQLHRGQVFGKVDQRAFLGRSRTASSAATSTDFGIDAEQRSPAAPGFRRAASAPAAGLPPAPDNSPDGLALALAPRRPQSSQSSRPDNPTAAAAPRRSQTARQNRDARSPPRSASRSGFFSAPASAASSRRTSQSRRWPHETGRRSPCREQTRLSPLGSRRSNSRTWSPIGPAFQLFLPWMFIAAAPPRVGNMVPETT